jgi:hypothetical protein
VTFREPRYAVLPLTVAAFPQPATAATFVRLNRAAPVADAPALAAARTPQVKLQPTVRSGPPPTDFGAAAEGLSVHLTDAARGRFTVVWKGNGIAVARRFVPRTSGEDAPDLDMAPFQNALDALEWIRRPLPARRRTLAWRPLQVLASGEALLVLLREEGATAQPGQGREFRAFLPRIGPSAARGPGQVLRTMPAFAEAGGPTPAFLAFGQALPFACNAGPLPPAPTTLAEGVNIYLGVDPSPPYVVVRRGPQTAVYSVQLAQGGEYRDSWRWLLAPVLIPAAVLADVTLGCIMGLAHAGG